MKIVLDTNIVIDAISEREPFYVDAQKILMMAATEKITCYLTSNSLTDIYYVLCKSLKKARAKDVIKSLLYSLEIIEVGSEDCWEALNSPMEDFEDALVAVCAEKVGVNYIVTRDEEFIKSSFTVPTATPAEFMREF
jgi:predicted nucleic acid-binding protein